MPRAAVGWRQVAAAGLVLALALPLFSCAYYNTFYQARKYYFRATEGLPYPVEKPIPAAVPNFTKSIEYSKKLIAQYPKDKWVDDAYLLWARALIATDDPRQAVKLLEDFPLQFPKSSLRDEATFYLGVANRTARKYGNAERAFDEFLAKQPKHDLTPYALLERSRTLMSLNRPEEAAAAASDLIDRFPKSKLRERAYVARADARFSQKEYDLARQDFRELGSRSRSDAERFEFMMREADCLEGARRYDDELKLLGEAISHEQAPAAVDTLPGRVAVQPAPTSLNYGRLLIRIGTVHLLSGRLPEALDAYNRVVMGYRRTDLAAEAQYRLGYAYETSADDFEKAREGYSRVKDHGGTSNFVSMANQRLTNLERLAQYRSAAGDSVQKKAEAGFLLAELYLFQLEKPDRALEEYGKIVAEFPETPIAAKAMNAQAWVLSRKLERGPEADSLFWAVVHNYPGTEAQLAARDYLEAKGVDVPADLIKLPEVEIPVEDTLATVDSAAVPVDSAAVLDSTGVPIPAPQNQGSPLFYAPGMTAPPMTTTPPPDSTLHIGPQSTGQFQGPALTTAPPPPPIPMPRIKSPADSTAVRDSTAAPPPDTTSVPPPDTTSVTPPDTTSAPPDTTRGPK